MKYIIVLILLLSVKLTNYAQLSSVATFPNQVYSLPLKSIYITSKYGKRVDPINKKMRYHSGIDLRCQNEEVMSMMQGTIKNIGHNANGLGIYMTIDHGVFDVTYGHLSHIILGKGQKVKPGTIVAISGNTGRSTGPHLHLSITYRGKKCNPRPLLSFIKKYQTLNQNYEQ